MAQQQKPKFKADFNAQTITLSMIGNRASQGQFGTYYIYEILDNSMVPHVWFMNSKEHQALQALGVQTNEVVTVQKVNNTSQSGSTFVSVVFTSDNGRQTNSKDFRDDEDSELVTIIIPHELLSEHITEYVDIVRQIADADGVNQMEALDMAKKVTHDRAGRVLKRELRDVGFELETSRRLFTLLLSLRVDTTRLVGIHGHRTIR